VNQCDEANFWLGPENKCCDKPVPDACVSGGWEVFKNYGFAATAQDNPPSFAAFKSEIDAGHPVMFAWQWNDGGGHMMVARGYRLLGNQQFSVNINDPWPPNGGDQYVLDYDDWAKPDSHNATFWRWYKNPHKASGHSPGDVPLAMAAAPKPDAPVISAAALVQPVAPEVFEKAAVAAKKNLAAHKLDAPGAPPLLQGTPVREADIYLSELGKGAPLHPSAVLSTLIVAGKAKSAVRMASAVPGAAPTAISHGHSALVGLISAVVGNADLLSKEKTIGAVRVRGLGLYFVSREVDGALQLAPIFDSPTFGLVKGKYEPADEVYERLKPFVERAKKGPM
jgi:hypothetical protein